MATSKLSGHGAAARSKRAPPMLEVCRVGRHSGSKRREPRRRTGEIVALLGSNGAGKSTLNNVLLQINPLAAACSAMARTSGTRARCAWSSLVSSRCPKGGASFPPSRVRQNLELGSFRRRRSKRARNLERARQIFARLAGRWEQFAGSLSGGEQQTLAIGRGLMSDPKLLILDEPSWVCHPSWWRRCSH